jgi:hypothetical protein
LGATGTGTSQDQNYGFSGPIGTPSIPANAPGNDIVLNTNGSSIMQNPNASYQSPSSGWPGWSAKLHSAGNLAGAGNVLLGDGSAQQVTSGSFRLNWLKNAEDNGDFSSATSFTSAQGAVRLLFP